MMRSVGDAETALELAELSTDAAEAEDFLREASDIAASLARALDAWELRRLLSGPYDDCPARLAIQAGAGGTDAQDYVSFLMNSGIKVLSLASED